MAPQIEEHEFNYTTNGGGIEKKTFFLAAGPKEGPLMVFCHGWPGIAKEWKPQMEHFAELGFRTVAPDMPGYGRSTARKVKEDYSLEQINLSMLALIDHLEREKAIWIGHDWGCGAVWSFAEHFPERCFAAAGLAVPSHMIELGLEELLKFVNREIYPEKEYPWGQWSYMKFYEDDFEKATAWFESDSASFLRAAHVKGSADNLGKPAGTSTVKQLGGWMGGIPKPDPKWKHIPLEMTAFETEEIFNELVEAMEKTGWWGADAYYSNHSANRAYFFQKSTPNNGQLLMPTLFIEAKFDTVCSSSESNLGDNMRKYCKDLTEKSVDAGHWVGMEKPDEVNAYIEGWVREGCKEVVGWPAGGVKAKV